MNIAVLDGYTLVRDDLSWSGLKEFGEVTVWPRSSGPEILSRLEGADIAVINKTPMPREVIAASSALRYIAVTATGYNVVDTHAARGRGIAVSNVPTYGTSTVAQYAMSLLLELCNHVGRHAQSVRTGDWSAAPDWTYWRTPQIELEGLTLGIFGFGRIGRRLAALGNAFGMKILYCSRAGAGGLPFPCERVTLPKLFAQSDVVSLHSSLGQDTTGAIDMSLFRQMKPTAFLINTARGQLLNEQDLADALAQGVLAGAALDVLATEPPAPANPLLTAPNCIVTPHVAWSSLAARRRILEATIENVKSFLAGDPIHVVNQP